MNETSRLDSIYSISMGIVVYPYTLFPGGVKYKYDINKRRRYVALRGAHWTIQSPLHPSGQRPQTSLALRSTTINLSRFDP